MRTKVYVSNNKSVALGVPFLSQKECYLSLSEVRSLLDIQTNKTHLAFTLLIIHDLYTFDSGFCGKTFPPPINHHRPGMLPSEVLHYQFIRALLRQRGKALSSEFTAPGAVGCLNAGGILFSSTGLSPINPFLGLRLGSVWTT